MSKIVYNINMTKKTDSDRPNDKELLELGGKLRDFYEHGYINKKQAVFYSFMKGVAGGAGAFVGGTLVIALVVWMLSLFDQVPLVGRVFEALQKALQR